MDNDFEQRVRERAYELWKREGRSGNPEDHWLRAERELKQSPEPSGGIAVEDTLPDDAIAAADSGAR